jgi:nucleotide-binding universal stress UspA family protein
VLRLDEPFADEPADTNAAFLVVTMLLAVAYPSAALLPQAEAAQVKVVSHVVIGSPYRKILETAAAENVGVIVMATHGRTGVSHLMMGSVAERIVRMATCPVLTLRPKE